MPIVLIAEDDHDIRAIFARVLKRAGFQVLTACDGQKALEIASSMRLDALISAVDMPRMNGLQLCSALRADTSLADLPIALLSGSLLPGDQTATRAKACRAWLKPISNIDLVTHLTDLIRTGRHGHPTTTAACRSSRTGV